MAILPFFFKEQRLLVTQVKGLLDDESLVRYYQGVCDSPDVGLDVPELMDLSEISPRSSAGKRGFQRVSEIVRAAYGPDAEPAQSASVAPNILIYGMMRMYELGFTPEATTVRVFRTFEPALSWLDRDPALALLIRTLEPEHPTFVPQLAVHDRADL